MVSLDGGIKGLGSTHKKNLDITKRIRQKALNEDDERASSLGEGLKLKPKAF